MKSILLSFCILFCSLGFVFAGTTPGQETSLRRSLRKSAGTVNTVETAVAPIASELPNTVSTQSAAPSSSVRLSGKEVSGSGMNAMASKSSASKVKTRDGKGLGQFSLRNLWQAGKSLKSYKQSGFIQISITIFLFIVILLLIGMLLGVILNDLFIIFYIATAVLLVWILLFMLGNLGIKKR